MGARRRGWCIALLVFVLAGLAPLAPSHANELQALPLSDGHGLTYVSQEWVELNQLGYRARTLDVTFTTEALSGPTKVRILLPRNYDRTGATRYPVLFLLHGGAADYRSWTALGGIAHIQTEHLPVITVMPDAGRSAWYTDWHNNGLGGPPKWETYHIDQLMPWVDDNLPTTGLRSGRAIAGLSSGGFGTMSYASRHPDKFVAAAAFSGAVDTNTPPVLGGKVIDALALQDRGIPGSLFGIRELEEVRWRGKNPWDLATNLAHTQLVLRTGNGDAGGPFGGGGPRDALGMYLEQACHRQSTSLHQRLDDLGIPHEWDDYGPGTHSFPYWNSSLERTLPIFMDVFRKALPDPEVFSYRSIEPTFSVYGWEITMARPVVEFADLDGVSRHGFALFGSGDASIVSAPIYRPGSTYPITLTGGFGERKEDRVADAAGRLHLDVPLGPPNLLQQQFTPLHTSPLTALHSTTVTIADPVTAPEATELAITGETVGHATTQVELAIHLTSGGDGRPLGGVPVVFELQGREHPAVTGADGMARTHVRLDGPAGRTPLTVRFGGDSQHEPAEATTSFTVLAAETTMTVSGRRDGPGAVLRAELRNAHGKAAPAQRQIVFTIDGEEVGRSTTDADGAAEWVLPRAPRALAAVGSAFAGDDTFRASSATTTWRGNEAPPATGASDGAASSATLVGHDGARSSFPLWPLALAATIAGARAVKLRSPRLLRR